MLESTAVTMLVLLHVHVCRVVWVYIQAVWIDVIMYMYMLSNYIVHVLLALGFEVGVFPRV